MIAEKTRFVLGQKSLSRLEEVHPLLSDVVRRAIELTDTDFQVFEGLRTQERQRQLVDAGASWTMNSRHLTGHAVDLVPCVDGPRWDWPLCYRVARAMQTAAKELHAVIVWGGVWDRTLNGLGNNLEREVEEYVTRRRASGMRAPIDGPHFELAREIYA